VACHYVPLHVLLLLGQGADVRTAMLQRRLPFPCHTAVYNLWPYSTEETKSRRSMTSGFLLFDINRALFGIPIWFQ
jgi:hypothetical protein